MERKTAELQGVFIDTFSFEEALDYAAAGQVVTTNPEMLNFARKNPGFAKIINEAELVIPDGIGVEIGLRILGHKVRRIPGIEFARELLRRRCGEPVALIGAKPDVIEKTVENLKNEIAGLNIVYAHDGYMKDTEPVTKALKEIQPALLLAALGSPGQEEFIYNLKNILPNTLMIGVGGSFDVWAGEVMRAPAIWQKFGLEWLYRTIKEPKRFKRIFPALPLFICRVIIEGVIGAKRGKRWQMNELKKLAQETRQNVVKMVYNAQSGHIGGALSATDILTVLYHKSMGKDDRFVLSKGHASAALYSVLAQCGYFPKEDLMTFRMFGSKLQGHPTLLCPGVHAATGSLGQGLSIACGVAMAFKLDENPAHIFTLMGDGELQEGNVWEGFMHAAHRNLDNITAVIDRNRLQIDGCTENIKAIGALANKIKAFGWDVQEIDGHNLKQIYNALEKTKKNKKPSAIIANTIKGKGVSFMENNAGWHGTAPQKEDYERAMLELEEGK